MGLILLNLVKRISPFFLIFFCLISSVFAIDKDLILNYAKIKEAISRNDTQKLFEIKFDIEKKYTRKKVQQDKNEAINLFVSGGVDSVEIIFLQNALENTAPLGHFIGFLFYPHINLINTVKTNFTQLPKALRASILIAAEYGFKPARDLVAFTSLGKVRVKNLIFNSEDELVSLLSIPFCCEDISVIEAAKTLLEEDNRKNIASFIEKSHASDNSIVLLNSVHLLKMLKINDEVSRMLDHAIDLGSKRAVIEKGFFIMEVDFGLDLTRAQSFLESREVANRGLGAYGFWKIAQCYRYGIGTKRNLAVANEFYLKAINALHAYPLKSQFSEIYYDTGEFATYYALSQIDPIKKVAALRQAAKHYKMASEFGMAPSFLKAAEIERQLGELEASGKDEIMEIATRAIRAGFFDEGATISRKYDLSIPTAVDKDAFIWAKAQQLSQDYEKIENKVKTW